MLRLIKKRLHSIYSYVFPRAWKRREELNFWKGLHRDGHISSAWYKPLYTDVYGLSDKDYASKRVLDIGCGPCGSLEWADMTAQRVGLDPLAGNYMKLGAADHRMEYAAAPSERIPFPDAHFDIVTCLNALDHVDDLDATIREIKRVLKFGGLFLLSVEIDHHPTATEPIVIDETALKKLAPELSVISSFKVGTPSDHNLHHAVRTKSPAYSPGEPGIYVARYVRL